MADWYLKQGNETTGPFTKQHLQELAAQENLKEFDLIREGQDGDFVSAGNIPDLFSETTVKIQSENKRYQFPHKKKSSPFVVIGIIGLLLCLIVLLINPFWNTRSRRRSVTKSNLKQMGLALHNYHEQYDIFPPGAITNSDGNSYHSWQTQILPFMDQSALYSQIDFKKPWKDPVNQKLFQQKIPYYLNPKIKDNFSPAGYALSHYVGNEIVLKRNVGIRLEDFSDGTSNTIIAVETGENFKPWGDPTALSKPVNIISPQKTSPVTGGNHILLGDGAVRYVSEDIDPAVLKALSTPNGGEEIGEY